MDEIAAKSGVDALKIERVLRLIMTQGWFRESKPGYFANNKQSNVIKKGAPGFYLATYMNELVHKVTASFPQAINHPDADFRKNTDPFHTAFNLAFNTDVSFLGPGGWLTRNPQEVSGFGHSMVALAATSDPGVLADFPWAAIAQGQDGIVDVGGGQGALCCSLAKKYPQINSFIVQDLAETRELAEQYIASQGLTDRVKFEAQDFFKPQRRKGKYTFVLQRILHGWSIEKGAEILKIIRDVLDKDSRIVIIDAIIQPGYSSATGPPLKDSLTRLGNIYSPLSPPAFVPMDFGQASRIPHQISVFLTALCNSFDRTKPQLEEMVNLAGLRIKKIYATRGWTWITEVEAGINIS